MCLLVIIIDYYNNWGKKGRRKLLVITSVFVKMYKNKSTYFFNINY